MTGFCRPQRRRRGPLGLVRDGDIVTIDLDRQVLDFEVPAAELERRRASFTPPAPLGEKGWLGVYERTVSPLSAGAALRGLRHGDRAARMDQVMRVLAGRPPQIMLRIIGQILAAVMRILIMADRTLRAEVAFRRARSRDPGPANCWAAAPCI